MGCMAKTPTGRSAISNAIRASCDQVQFDRNAALGPSRRFAQCNDFVGYLGKADID
jgi:hypothetical protein